MLELEVPTDTNAPPPVRDAEEDGFAVVMSRLCELPYFEEDEDYTRPTLYSFQQACALLTEARCTLPTAFPRASFSTSEMGGVQVYWRKPGFLLQLSLPAGANGNGYLHLLRDGAATIDPDPTGQTLAQSLTEFQKLTEFQEPN